MPVDERVTAHLQNGHVRTEASKVETRENAEVAVAPEVDEFGLPIRKAVRRTIPVTEDLDKSERDSSDSEAFVDAPTDSKDVQQIQSSEQSSEKVEATAAKELKVEIPVQVPAEAKGNPPKENTTSGDERFKTPEDVTERKQGEAKSPDTKSPNKQTARHSVPVASEWSHMQLAPKLEKEDEEEKEDEWQTMPAYAPYDIYDDNNKLLAKEETNYEDEMVQYGTLGGAGKGYTRVQLDEDAQSVTSMDDNTAYLFKDAGKGTTVTDEDDGVRDTMDQMQATKELLTEGQRIAYVGTVRLTAIEMFNDVEKLEKTKNARKAIDFATASLLMWSQKIMLRLYAHMEIGHDEQLMIEQLAEHGVQAGDLTPALMINARVKNPAKEEEPSSERPSVSTPQQSVSSPRLSLSSSSTHRDSLQSPGLKSPSLRSPGLKVASSSASIHSTSSSGAPPPYDEYISKEGFQESLDVKSPSELGDAKSIDIDIRWTVLCDLFLILIRDSIYDARSRRLLERVGEHLQVSWLDICRFEKRVTDALEVQEAADKENWNEDEHMKTRQKQARNRRLMVMGLATVGGGLVIGLSAGLLAPVIGAGLAAGFTTIGVAGTSGFLAGAGGAAIVTTTGIVTGGTIGVRAANRRTGAVKTFEYRPLHNNKRVNLVVTIAGWMNGKVDDVRLPFSTVDPIMGDIYSIHWEPEMLQSMGQTISILATEALTQTLQQILGSTVLIALMAALQLPVLLTKLSYLIDNPWNVSLARADLAGLILADSLIDRNLGSRPITLVGFSLGARVIYSCLRELAKRRQTGLIQNVYVFGSPCIANKNEFLKCRSVVSGRFLNGYATNDWILAYLFRITGGGIAKVAGLTAIDDVAGIENVNVTEWVPGHMSYRAAMPRLLREVGWEVESDEFTEIEDPDPDNHEKRQRELINEIEEARRQIEEEKEGKGKKSKFSFWRKKKGEKKGWETYEEQIKSGVPREEEPELKEGELEKRAEGVLFDIDAIRAEVKELAGQDIEIKQLESTLPPMKITMDSPEPTPPLLRATKSQNDSIGQPSTLPSTSSWAAPLTADRSTFDYDVHGGYSPATNRNEEITMTFDVPANLSNKPPAFAPLDDISRPPSLSNRPSPALAAQDDISGPSSLSNKPSPAFAPQTDVSRPPLKSHATAPSPVVNMHPEHNAWADEDEDFGQEQEIKMTFA